MSILDIFRRSAGAGEHPLFDLANGDLPPWLTNFVSIARPLFVAGNVAIPVLGATTVGIIAWWAPHSAHDMMMTSTGFLRRIPSECYAMITALALGYTAAKTLEVVKAPPPPAGRVSPEGTSPGVDEAAPAPEVPTAETPTSRPRAIGTEILE